MSKKIYFCGSIRGGLQDTELYIRLIDILKAYGTVLTEHIWPKVLAGGKERADKVVHDQDVEWLTSADYIVAEVTQPSLGVGYEIGGAVAMGKKILCLFRPQPDKKLSAMIAGADNGTDFVVKEYSEPDAETIFKEFFK